MGWEPVDIIKRHKVQSSRLKVQGTRLKGKRVKKL
jgi:hypothetical protein